VIVKALDTGSQRRSPSIRNSAPGARFALQLRAGPWDDARVVLSMKEG
jgi:hypothetical protein